MTTTMFHSEIRTEKGEMLLVTYTLLEEIRGYGVRVTEELRGDQAEARELSSDRAEVEELLTRLFRCQVTPTTLHDVAYDWLCGKYTLKK